MSNNYFLKGFIRVLLGVGFAALFLPCLVKADVLSINYPAPNDIISESARIRLNVTSNGTSADCLFSYDNVSNQSVGCNGVSLVDMPNADETYRVRVTDDSGSYVDQQVTIMKPSAITVNFIYGLTIFLLCSVVFWIFYLIKKLAMIMIKWFDVAISTCVYIVFLIVYQLNWEYINVPFILDYMNLFFTGSLYVLLVFPLVGFFVCGSIRSMKKKKKKLLTIEEM